MTRKFLALLLCIAVPLPAAAQTHVVAELGTAPLIGQVASTQTLQNDVTRERAIFEAAGLQLGLTPAEFEQFAQRIRNRELSYVTIPRRLDAMSWRSGRRVHVLRDVVIPAHTMGWEIDLAERGQILALFIPNKCGNLSLLRKPLPALARAPQVKAVAAAPAPVPPPTAAPTSAPSIAPAIAPTPAPYTSVSMSTPSAPAHHPRLWPLLLLPIVAALVSHGGHGTPAGIAPLPVGPAAPAAPLAGCPTPPPH